jgi:hypothetical protein
MPGKPKAHPAELVEKFSRLLRETHNVSAASRGCGYSKSFGRGMLAKFPELRAFVVAPWKQRVKHREGARLTPEYRAWSSMRSRCNDTSSRDYPKWGGRGIRVSPRWDDFQLFLADVGNRPSRLHSLDRIDNRGNYEPGNVRWATAKEQAENRRSTTLVEYAGQRLTVSEWARRLGLPQATLWNRLFQLKWPLERALAAKRVA